MNILILDAFLKKGYSKVVNRKVIADFLRFSDLFGTHKVYLASDSQEWDNIDVAKMFNKINIREFASLPTLLKRYNDFDIVIAPGEIEPNLFQCCDLNRVLEASIFSKTIDEDGKKKDMATIKLKRYRSEAVAAIIFPKTLEMVGDKEGYNKAAGQCISTLICEYFKALTHSAPLNSDAILETAQTNLADWRVGKEEIRLIVQTQPQKVLLPIEQILPSGFVPPKEMPQSLLSRFLCLFKTKKTKKALC